MNIKAMQVGPIGTNCYILEDSAARQAAVIDPGGDAPRLLAALKGLEVRYILLTHGHYDHIGAVAPLHQALPDSKVYLHKAPVPYEGGRGGLFHLFSRQQHR